MAQAPGPKSDVFVYAIEELGPVSYAANSMSEPIPLGAAGFRAMAALPKPKKAALDEDLRVTIKYRIPDLIILRFAVEIGAVERDGYCIARYDFEPLGRWTSRGVTKTPDDEWDDFLGVVKSCEFSERVAGRLTLDRQKQRIQHLLLWAADFERDAAVASRLHDLPDLVADTRWSRCGSSPVIDERERLDMCAHRLSLERQSSEFYDIQADSIRRHADRVTQRRTVQRAARATLFERAPPS